MDWKTTLNAQIQQMRNENNARFRGGYTGPAIRDHECENKRIDDFMKNRIDHFQAIDLKELEKKVESKNKFLKDILLTLPSKDFQSILDKYPPVFQIEKVDYPGVSIIKCSISTQMLTDLYEALAKCLTYIKSKIDDQSDIDLADKLYNKSTILEGPDKSAYHQVISRTRMLYYIYQANYIKEIIIVNIKHKFIDKIPTIQVVKPVRYYSENFMGGYWIEKEVSVEKKSNSSELYMKIGTRYLHVFIDPEINKKLDDIIWPNNYAKWTHHELDKLKHNCLNHIRTTTRINPFSKLELKRQEQELIDAEVEKRLKKKQFEKQVLERLEEKKLVKNTIVIQDTIKTNLEDIHKDINYWSSLGEV